MKGAHMVDEATTDTKSVPAALPKPDLQVKVVAADMPSTTATQQAGTASPSTAANPQLALLLLIAAFVVIFGTGVYWFVRGTSPGYTGGGAAACAGVLLFIALLVQHPSLIMDDAPDAGGEPSTMRILTVIIVLTFAVLVLRTGWNSGSLPTLENQSNWIWLVTAALGGKALQKFAEVQDKKR
jgi:hypothetical protein